MEKRFFDVFPKLKLNDELTGLFEDVLVTKASSSKRGDILRVYIESPRLITKDRIYRAEKEIKKQIFYGRKVSIHIIEDLRLSSQYDLKNLIALYKESILLEFKHESLLEYSLLSQAKWEVKEDNVLRITLKDGLVARDKENDIYLLLEKIINGRCHMQAGIDIDLTGGETPVSRALADERMRAGAENTAGLSAAPKGESLQEDTPGEGLPWDEKPNAAAVPEDKTGAISKGDAGDGKEKAAQGADQKSSKGKKKTSYSTGKKGGGRYGSAPLVRSDDPDVVYGRNFADEAIPIAEVEEGTADIVVRGKVISVDMRSIRGERTIVMFALTDLTDSIMAKIFCSNDDLDQVKAAIKKGEFLKVKGAAVLDRFDKETAISNVYGIKRIPPFGDTRMDSCPQKRVELHCHTKMSDMDAVSDAKDIINRAKLWGHKAIAVTDHGNVQAFPDAMHALDPDDDFKVIYGVEAYLVDDTKGIVKNPAGQSLDGTFVVFDLETTGLSAAVNAIIEIGAVKVEGGKVTDRFSAFVNPGVPIPYEIEKLTGIKDDMVSNAPSIDEVLPDFMEFCRGAVMVAHNADFDMSFIQRSCQKIGIDCKKTVIDTVSLSRALLPSLKRYKLDTVAKALGVSLLHHHRAVDDALCTAEIFIKLSAMLKDKGIDSLNDISGIEPPLEEAVKKLPTYHAIILAKNETGRVNLYRLISDSHIKYFHRVPRMPKSEIQKHREGLILGSACEAGELFRAVAGGREDSEILRIASFYDYFEIQPVGNNAFMIRSEKEPAENEDDLKELNKKIVRLGEKLGKKVAATCDVHFLDPQDEVYRRIIMSGKGFKDADLQPPLYLHTTDEMLEEFSYLGSKKAYEVVVENTNLIADMCEKISPVRPDKCPPVIEDSDKTLREICCTNAKAIYGDPLPKAVSERLERELSSIISNGFAVMYIIAQKLVWKSNEDGYLVGSRGSVGSSFAATMAGITEVNPLSPHYVCENCHYTDFDSELVKSYSGRAGCDMPDKDCPVCGKKLKKDGFDIPFETFLGFKGNKEPDIDLNFSGEYQSKAHKYTEVIFGEGQTYRAGTIGTLADKTAFGYVKNYYEERGERKRACEINRIVSGCVGVRRTTGQHPGGIIVLPIGEDINSFTPVQHPANDTQTDIITTHFDYHSIDHNLLKLDILGHDDPTMIRMLQDLTGVDPKTIPLDSPEVMSLFGSCEALGIKPEDIGGCRLGTLGIPEFGTDFAMQMLIDTKPKAFSDLVRIAGLAHGTDVWLGNAQTLIAEGKATISTAICTRDDIMTYLISMGLDKELSFTVMESVRKGKGLKSEWEEEMLACGVPDWYIWSCKKIKYMFPKAHAAAYVMMAWRIAWWKIFYPLAYYAAYFSVRATGFSYELMCFGPRRLADHMADYEKRKDTLTKKEQDTYRDMRVVQEMYARGFEFVPIDIYTAAPRHFRIVDGKLMPSLDSIEGMGEKAADAVPEAVKDGKFLSLDDFKERTKVSRTVVDYMVELGVLKGLPKSNQLSLFDVI